MFGQWRLGWETLLSLYFRIERSYTVGEGANEWPNPSRNSFRICSKPQYKKLCNYLSIYIDLALYTNDYKRAAEFFYTNRKKGIQGSNTDFLIGSICYRYGMPLLTTDNDFSQLKEHIPIKLNSLRVLK